MQQWTQTDNICVPDAEVDLETCPGPTFSTLSLILKVLALGHLTLHWLMVPTSQPVAIMASH